MPGYDHIQLKVASGVMQDTITAYSTALAPLGITKALELGGKDGAPLQVGFAFPESTSPIPFFWLAETSGAPTKVHIAFNAATRAQVDAFYAAGIEAGFTCNGKPGVRAEYHPNFYATFIHDGAGNNLEAVCHNPPA